MRQRRQLNCRSVGKRNWKRLWVRKGRQSHLFRIHPEEFHYVSFRETLVEALGDVLPQVRARGRDAPRARLDALKVKSGKRAHVETGCDVGAGVSSADIETPRCRRRVSFVSFLCSFSLLSLLLSAFILLFFAGESTHPARTKTERSFWKAGELLYTRTDDSERTERSGVAAASEREYGVAFATTSWTLIV